MTQPEIAAHMYHASVRGNGAVASSSTVELLAAWERVRRDLSSCLHEQELSVAWLPHFRMVVTRLRELTSRDVDAALHLLIHATGVDCDEYSVQHAMTCAIVAELSARRLAYCDAEIEALVLAAHPGRVSRRRGRPRMSHRPLPTTGSRSVATSGAVVGAQIMQSGCRPKGLAHEGESSTWRANCL